MSQINYLHKIVPELNFWVNRTLFNNNFNRTVVQCPTKISSYWRSKDSVIEILFNETADPSGTAYDGGYHFIWTYRTINNSKLSIVEPLLFKRIQVYYNSSWIYAAKNDTKFNDLFNLVNNYITSGDQNYEYPYGIHPTQYLNYNSHIVGTGSDQLNYDDPEFTIESESENEYIVYNEAENVFELTNEELALCEYLYKYRKGEYESIPNFTEEYFNSLVSPLSKWVCIYLKCYLYNTVNENHLRTYCKDSNESFRCLVEKHLQDRVYQYIQKQNMTLWERIDRIDDSQDKRSFHPYTLCCGTLLQKGRVQYNSDGILFTDLTKTINNQNTFEFIYDGEIQKHGEDYVLKNIGNESKQMVKLMFLNKNKYAESQKFQFMYNYVIPKTPFTGIKQIDFA